ncbi:MAG TPA: Xaa-Pro peptidase family protein [Planctomycetota bacterium]|nr:Xaa-Pro peptidase family protein [Planctomycetota bacterium]
MTSRQANQPNPFSSSEIRPRLERLRQAMREQRLDALLVSSVPSVRYLSGFTGDSSVALVTRTGQYLLTDFRFEEEAAITAPLFRCLVRRLGMMELVEKTARRLRLRRLGFEEQVLTAAELRDLGGRLGRSRLVPTAGVVERLRMIKSPAEIAVLRRAAAAAERGLLLARRAIRPGATEAAVAAELRRCLVARCGAQDQAFETIIAEGPRGSLPHARPTDRKVRRGSLVLVDWGARVGFYHSDLTRVLALGKAPPLYRKLVKLVRQAQLAAMEIIRPGVPLADVDRAARAVIERAGYGPRFGHALGHGIGLQVHEAPRLWARAAEKAEPGMVFTVEPGIYLPGKFGIRIEDDVLVTATGMEVLSSLPHDERLAGEP